MWHRANTINVFFARRAQRLESLPPVQPNENSKKNIVFPYSCGEWFWVFDLSARRYGLL
jgi:hypothetical protein